MHLLGIQIGHLHPLLVHLPIGIILFAFLLEIFDRLKKNKNYGDVVEFTLLVAAISALLSLGTGWLLGADGGYDPDLLFNHRWMAVAFTVTSILLYTVKRFKAKWSRKLYLPIFILTLILISVTGHYGGNMTHGEGYLFIEESPEVVIENIDEAKVYAEIIAPILDAKCVSCHNPKKAKGGLLLTDTDAILAGGDTGSPLDTLSNEIEPLLLHRIHLPVEDDEHMPPKGKVQLTSNEVALLEWWLKNQHCFDCLVRELSQEQKLAGILQSLEQDTSSIAVLAKKAEAVPLEWLKNVRSRGISIQTLSKQNQLLAVSMAGSDSISSKDFDILEDYSDNIVELDLGFTNMNDDLIKYIGPFENLLKLKLSQTNITDSGAKYLGKFELLESLNLYGTKVSDKIIPTLKENKNLAQIYLWNTDVSLEGMALLQKELPKLKVQQINDDVFKSTELEAPVIIAETSFFKDSLEISVESLFDDVTHYYTLDGTLPTTYSKKYTGTFFLKHTANVNVVAIKEGWEPSKIGSATFIKNNIEYAGISLNNKPNEKYSGQGGKTLLDQRRGTVNFVDGNWLGFEGKNFTAQIELKEVQKISSIAIGALSAPASWIFYPTGFTISTSMDGKSYKVVERKEIGVEKPNAEVKFTFFYNDFVPTEAKFVKVEVLSPLKNPDWHPNPGGKSWIFIDEMVLN